MKRTLYVLPIAGAAALVIPCLTQSRRVEIQEDDSTTNQGIIAFFKTDNYTQGKTVAPTHEPLVIGNKLRNANGRGDVQGFPIQKDVSQTITMRAADIYCKLTSATATVTKVWVEEFE